MHVQSDSMHLGPPVVDPLLVSHANDRPTTLYQVQRQDARFFDITRQWRGRGHNSCCAVLSLLRRVATVPRLACPTVQVGVAK